MHFVIVEVVVAEELLLKDPLSSVRQVVELMALVAKLVVMALQLMAVVAQVMLL